MAMTEISFALEAGTSAMHAAARVAESTVDLAFASLVIALGDERVAYASALAVSSTVSPAHVSTPVANEFDSS